jgi:hypothetical protein
MRAKILRYGAVFAVVLGFGAWTAQAGSITAYKAVDLKINQDWQGQNEDRLVLNSGLGSSSTGPTLQGILDLIQAGNSGSGAPGNPGFLGGIVGGRPGPFVVGLPGVNPIPEPRTWVLYVLSAVLGVWVVRRELRAS